MGNAVFLSSRMIVSGPEDDALGWWWWWWISSARLANAEHLCDYEGETIDREKSR